MFRPLFDVRHPDAATCSGCGAGALTFGTLTAPGASHRDYVFRCSSCSFVAPA